jgi:hypothetical protein
MARPPLGAASPPPLASFPHPEPTSRRGAPATMTWWRGASRLVAPYPCPGAAWHPCAAWPRPGVASARAAAVPLRSAAHAWLVRGASARPCAHVLAWCAQCFGAARRALDTTRSVLSRVTCSSTPRRACLPLATRLPPPPEYFMRVDHVICINEMETQIRN